MKVALATGTGAGSDKPGFTPPGIEELARKFPQLEIIELIGRGGMGAVYKARQKELDRIVALKILPPGMGDAAAFAERFTREAKALARLNHPGIITIHDSGQADGLYFFLMEFVDGVNLRQLLATGRVSPREALAIVPQICDALQFAHDQGIVHRDIKPENILLDRRGRVKVADFGLAKLVGAEALTPTLSHLMGEGENLTAAGKVMGTPAYMAPEQARHPDEVDHRADIYALGVVFYQMLTGELPGQRIEAPSKKVHIDVRLDEVVLRALEKKPELRYQQVSEVKTGVEAIVEAEPSPVEPQTSALWPGFTPHALQVLALARKEADHFRHNFIGTEHLLLGLIKLGQGVAAKVLLKLALDQETVRKEVEKAIGEGADQKLTGDIDYTPRVKKILALATLEARMLNHACVGPEHILLGLLQLEDGLAADIFAIFAVDRSETRQKILQELNPPGPVELKLKWPPPGRRIVLRFDMKQSTEHFGSGQPPYPLKHDFTMGLEYAFTTLKEIPEGGREVEMEFLGARIGTVAGGMTWQYDSAKKTSDDPASHSTVTGTFGKIVGAKVRYFLDASHRVERMEGVDELMNQLKPGVSLAQPGGPADPFAWVRNMFCNIFTETYFRRLARLNRLLPPMAVQPGNTWAVPDAYPGDETPADFKVTFQSWEMRANRPCARLEFQAAGKGTVKNKTEATISAGSGMVLHEGKWVEAKGQVATSVLEGTTSGAAWFDPELGLTRETNAINDFKMMKTISAVPTENPDAAGPSINTSQKLHQVITVKLVSVG
jgi:tRNA A-37 threonylcarbamoyl transferase component Bud32